MGKKRSEMYPKKEKVEETSVEKAEDFAARMGYFATSDWAKVEELSKKGLEPLRVDGPKPHRQHKLFIYAISSQEGKEKISAQRNQQEPSRN